MLLPTAVALLGFASSPGGGPDTVAGGCADTPDSAMIQITGGKTCSDLAAAGRCTSTDDLVATVMARNCMASCGGCVETLESRSSYVMHSGAPGDFSCKEYLDPAINYGISMMALTKEAAEQKVCAPKLSLLVQDRAAFLTCLDAFSELHEDVHPYVRGCADRAPDVCKCQARFMAG